MSNFIREGFNSITTALYTNEPEKMANYYSECFGATLEYKLVEEEGSAFQVVISINGTKLILIEAKDAWGIKGVEDTGYPGSLQLYVENVENVISNCLNSGSKELVPLQKLPGGDFGGSICDPFGVNWRIVSTEGPASLIQSNWTEENFEFEVVEISEASGDLLALCSGACCNC